MIATYKRLHQAYSDASREFLALVVWLRHKPFVESYIERLPKLFTLKRAILGVLFIPLGIYLYVQVTRSVIILDPINVPKEYTDKGLTSEVMTQRLRVKLEEIRATSETASPKDDFSDDSNQAPDVDIPDTKVSLQVIIDALRRIFHTQSRHISGEIVVGQPDQGAEARIRVLRPGRSTLSLKNHVSTEDPDEIIGVLAQTTAELIDPFLYGLYLENNNRLTEASAIADRMLLEPTGDIFAYSKAHVLRADIAIEQKHFDVVQREIDLAMKLAPSWAYPHMILGLALAQQNKLDEAVAEYSRAIHIDGRNPSAYTDLGNALNQQGKYNEALAEYRRALQLDPKNSAPHLGLGNVFYSLSMLNHAAREYSTAISLDPLDPNPHLGLGGVLDQQKIPELAAEEYRRSVYIAPSYWRSHWVMGSFMVKNNQLFEAEGEYRRAIKLGPDESLPHSSLAEVLVKQLRPDEAASEYRIAINLDPADPDNHVRLGFLLAKQNELNNAASEYRIAINLDPGNPLAHRLLSDVLKQQNKLDEAEVEFRTAQKVGVWRLIRTQLQRIATVLE